MKNSRAIYLILGLAGFSFSLFGYDQGLFGGVLANANFRELIGNPDSTMTGLVTAIYDLGCAVGAIAAFVISEPMGRKRSIFAGNFVLVVGTIIQTASFGYVQMTVGRLIGGIGVGFMTVAIPIYQSETLPANSRGALFTVQSFFIIFGVMIASWLTFGCYYIKNSAAWRIPVGFQAVFAGAALMFMPFVVESPRWLANHGRHEEALRSVAILLDKPVDDPATLATMKEIDDGIEFERQIGQASWAEVFKGQNLQRAVLGMGPYLMNQWSGINVISYYQAPLFENILGYTPTVSLLLAGAAVTQYCITSALPYFYMDKVGRRPVIMVGSALCGICMYTFAGCIANGSKVAGAFGTLMLFLYQDFFGMGILPVSWSYASEISPLRIRAKANAVGVTCHWLSNFVIVFITPYGIASLQWRYFFVWASLLLIFVPTIYIFFPETANKSLEDMDRGFAEHPGPFQGLGPNAKRGKRGAVPAKQLSEVRAADPEKIDY